MPKALCTVGGVPLVDLALERLHPVTSSIAVNAHHFADQLVAHVGARAYVSVEQPEPLGTAGAVGALRSWIDGRAVLATNADAWLRPNDVHALIEDWDEGSVRVLVVRDAARADFDGRWRFAGASLMPSEVASSLAPVLSSLHERVWRPRHEAGELVFVEHRGEFIDCGTPADLEAANLAALSR